MNAPLFDLSGQVALVTGASSGLGLSIAQTFAACGARVIVAGIDSAACERVAAELRNDGHVATAMACDLAQRASVDALADAALACHGRVDTLVCNAGIQGPAGPLAEATEHEWDAVMTVNLRSMAWLSTRLIPPMAARGGGSVTLMSSIAGLRGNKAIGLYSLSKAAVAALARNLAVEWGPQGVRVNAISPGLIRTPLAEGMLADAALMHRRLSLTPLRRVGEPHEVAGAAVMLASRSGGFITGHNLVIDGGTTIGDGN